MFKCFIVPDYIKRSTVSESMKIIRSVKVIPFSVVYPAKGAILDTL